MRYLDSAEMSFVSGGHDPENAPKEVTMPEIVVEAERPRSTYDTALWNLLLARFNYQPPDANDPNHPEECFLKNADPLLDTAPAGVDVRDIRQMALAFQDYVKGKDQSIEFAAVVISDQYGNLRLGPITSGTATSVPISNDAGANERVVAIVHSHPQLTPNGDHSVPSTDASNGVGNPNDEDMFRDAMARGVIDPKGLMYIIDNSSGQMYEYDPTDIRKDNRNNITDDLQQHGLDCSY